MDPWSILTWILYGVAFILGLWAFGRIFVWQVARFMKAWFKIDIIVASVGLLSANGIAVRVNDLQSLEIDKVSLKIRPKASHPVSLHFGDVRIRAERNLSPGTTPDKGSPSGTKTDQSTKSNSVQPKRLRILQWLAKHLSVHIDAVNIMLLNAFVPDSLLHLDVSDVNITGGGTHVLRSSAVENLAKKMGNRVREDGNIDASIANVGLLLSVGELRGKILKSNKEGTDGNTCIAEVTASFNVGAVASSVHPKLCLQYVGVDFEKLAVELHSGALIPGVLLPQTSHAVAMTDILDFQGQRKPVVPLREAGPIKTAHMLPMLTQGRISNFHILLIGDPPPTSKASQSHSGAEKVLYISLTTLTVSQRKDPGRTVTVSSAAFANTNKDDVIDLPTGYIRMKMEDFTVSNTSKVKLVTLSRISAETKMTSNCVLSSSLDFTLCYMHYVHKEAMYWTQVLEHKLTNAKSEQTPKSSNISSHTGRLSFGRPASDKMARKNQNAAVCSPKGEGISSREIPPRSPFLQTHKRTRSAPNNFYHVQSYVGGPPKRPELTVPKDLTSLVNVLNSLGISTVCECTFYEATVDVTLPQNETCLAEKICIFSLALDCVTMSIDHSANSQDINFMAKLDRVCWKPRNNVFDDLVSGSSDSGHAGRWTSTEALPHHKTDVHEWGTAFNLDALRLHGQSTFSMANGALYEAQGKPDTANSSFWPRQHIATSVDAKVAGVQIEFSQVAAQCIASVLSCLNYHPLAVVSTESAYCRQTSLAPGFGNHSGQAQKKLKMYSFSFAFAEIDVSHVNIFLLPSDKTGCADCLVARIDSLKAEANLKDRKLNVMGIGVTNVPNPYFSAFASYESGSPKGRKSSLKLTSSAIPLSVRQQQSKVSRYHCVSADDMRPLYIGLNCLDVEYKVIEREDLEKNLPTSVRTLSVSLNHDRDVTIYWSPKLHMLVHHEAMEIIHILRDPSSSPRRSKRHVSFKNSPPKQQKMKAAMRKSFGGTENHEAFSYINRMHKPTMAGDGPAAFRERPSQAAASTFREVSVTTNSRICFNVILKDSMSVEFQFNPIRYTEVGKVSTICFSKAQVIMDCHSVFTFMNVKIELSAKNDKLQQDRSSFTDLLTQSNRAWSFSMTLWSCHFPHNYDFASTFDQFVTTFKWVKGLYRKTSHPFRSPKLPPDLLIAIDKFIFEIADWDFECRLRDNHELMKDEWRESEKRRRILDQRVADLRRERGELLPAKKIEELYQKLEEKNTRIYVDRCKTLHSSKDSSNNSDSVYTKTHTRSFSVPPHFLTSCDPAPPTEESEPSPVPEAQATSQIRSSSFSYGCQGASHLEHGQDTRLYPPLFTWTITTLNFSVLADESMHGMENAIETIKNIDKVSPFPQMKDEDGATDGYEFVTLWCRNIRLQAARHQCRIRNYPQYLMDVSDWRIWGKFCGAEQKGSPSAQRTECVPLPLPWGPAKVNRNMPALKFFHDWSSDVQSFSMAWGPCWDPAWSQVSLAMNLLNHPSVDPSTPMTWWDKSRLLFHGRLMMTMDRSSLLQLASLDPYNTTEHMHWDWKSVLMDWTNGNFLFKGDLDIHIRNASKYDDIRFLHLPNLRMEWDIKWLCKDGCNPDDHYLVEPCAPDKVPGDPEKHDSFRNFRSENLNLSVSLDVRGQKSDCAEEDGRNAEILFYSTTLRWLTNFATAINGVTRPVCKGSIFNNHSLPKLKLSRHYKTNTISFKFPSLKMRYWSSYTQQLGIEWRCGEGSIESKCKLSLIPFEGPLLRRSRGDWSIVHTTCELSQTKVYLIKQHRNNAAAQKDVPKEVDEISQHSSSSASSSNHEQTASSSRGCLEANFLLSFSNMSYRMDNDFDEGQKYRKMSSSSSSSSNIPPTPAREPRNTLHRDKRRASQRNRRPPATPRKPPSQHRHQLVVHDLRAMWTTDNRDVGFGLYEGYNKSAVLKHNLSTKVLKNIIFKPSENTSVSPEGGSSGSGSFRSHTPSVSSDTFSYGPEPVSPGEKLMQSANSLLKKLIAETDNRFVVGPEVPSSEKEQLTGVAACQMNDVINQNWRMKFLNCQAMLKGPKTQGYIILTAAEADLVNRDHKVSWRDGQLTSKSTWMGSLNDMQIFATVERNVNSSGKDGENVPWLTTADIEPRGPSPGMLDISDLMTGGQAIGGVVGDGVSAGSFQLQRIMSRCSCRMYYVGYESIVDSEETDYGQLLTSPTPDRVYQRLPEFEPVAEESGDLLGKEKPVNILTVVQPDLEICTNTSQYSMVLDIVENLVLFVEPGMQEHWERVDRMRFQLQLTSLDDVARHRETLTRLQDEIRQRLNNIRQLERDLFRVDRALEKDPTSEKLMLQSSHLQSTLVNEKETLKVDSEELGIIIRCFKELYLKQKTKTSVNQGSDHEEDDKWDEEVAVARRTEVSFAQVKWHLTDADGQLTIAKFELRDFLYEKVNKSDDFVEHLFELGWLCLQNLLPNTIYLDVLKPQGPVGANSYTVVGSGSRRLALRALCKVRPPVGGISIKEHLELNVVPLTIQLTDQFFKRMMSFFFPGKNSVDEDQEDHTASKDNLNATLLGLGGTAGNNSQSTLKPKVPSPPKKKGSNSSLAPPVPPPPKTLDQATPGGARKNWRHNRSGKLDVADDVDKMKQRAAKNNTFLYIKIPQFPLCVSYKGEKEKNIKDVRDFNLTIPMLVYHNMTWTWHDLAMAIKRDCKRTLFSQAIKEKFHLGSTRGTQKEPHLGGAGISRSSSSLPSSGRDSETSDHKKDEDKIKILFGNSLKRAESHRKSLFKRKK